MTRTTIRRTYVLGGPVGQRTRYYEIDGSLEEHVRSRHGDGYVVKSPGRIEVDMPPDRHAIYEIDTA